MYAIAKAVFPRLRAAIDVFLSLVSIPSGAVMWLYRRIGSRRLPLTTRVLRRMGVFPIRDHYYEPLFNDKHLSDPLDAPRDLPGVDFNVSGQLELLEQLPYADEFEKFVDSEQASQAASAYELDNIGFRAGDAEFLLQMIRRFRLKQVCPYLERRSEPDSLYFRIRSSDRE